MRAGASRANRRVVKTGIPVERSSGNVFEDIGLAQSAELLVKSQSGRRMSPNSNREGHVKNT